MTGKESFKMIKLEENTKATDFILKLQDIKYIKSVITTLQQKFTRNNLSEIRILVEINNTDNKNKQMVKFLIAETRRLLATTECLKTVIFITTDHNLRQSLNEIINRHIIVCLGDSITYGYPWGPEHSWVNLAAQITGKTLVNRGINGDSTENMLHRFPRDVIPYEPAYVHILGGTNDAWLEQTADSVLKNIKTMTGMALKEGICPILGLPTPLNPQGTNFFGDLAVMKELLDEYRIKILNFARKHNFPTINYYHILCQPGGESANPSLFFDQGHPNKLGYSIMAKNAGKLLHKLK